MSTTANTLPRLDMPARGKSAAIVTTPQGEFFFSYRTVIAFRGEDKDGNWRKVRLENYWSRTTGRHFSDLDCKGFDIVSPEEFAKVIGFTGDVRSLTERA